jgi:hypothetical protein
VAEVAAASGATVMVADAPIGGARVEVHGTQNLADRWRGSSRGDRRGRAGVASATGTMPGADTDTSITGRLSPGPATPR